MNREILLLIKENEFELITQYKLKCLRGDFGDMRFFVKGHIFTTLTFEHYWENRELIGTPLWDALNE